MPGITPLADRLKPRLKQYHAFWRLTNLFNAQSILFIWVPQKQFKWRHYRNNASIRYILKPVPSILCSINPFMMKRTGTGTLLRLRFAPKMIRIFCGKHSKITGLIQLERIIVRSLFNKKKWAIANSIWRRTDYPVWKHHLQCFTMKGFEKNV